MITRFTPTAQHKQRASSHIRQLAKDVHQTFPDMDVHQHLTDAAREIDAGRHDNAKRHLDAAINAFAPLHLTRHGIHDDEGHRAAKSFMQRAHRGRLLAADAEAISGQNEQLTQNRKDAAMADAEQRAAARNPQLQPAGPAAVVPAPAARQMSWDGVCDAIELATFAGKPPGSGANFAKLKGTLAKRGAKDPGALAAYIGRKKYGRKGFAKLGRGSSHATPAAGGIELVGPKGYIHGWIHASMATLSKSGGGAYLPEHPGFGARTPGTLTRSQHRKAAAGHLHMMKQAPAGSDKARLHHKFAKLHAAASMAGASYAQAPRTGAFASEQAGIELAFNPGQPRDSGGRWTHAGSGSSVHRVSSWVAGERAASYHGKRIRGDTGNGVVEGVYNHRRGTVRDDSGTAHRVTAIDPTAYDARFKGDVASSHLPGDIKEALSGYERDVSTGKIRFGKGGFAESYPGKAASEAGLKSWARTKGALSALTIQASWEDLDRAIELSADTGRLAAESHPFGKPDGPGLWGVKGMELPPYIQNIARALLRTGRAKTLSQAIAMAKGATARWAGGKNTRPEVRAASAATNASWAAKQARAHTHSNSQPGIELVGPHGYTHNWVYHGRPGASPGERADELSHYLAHHALHGEDRHAAHLEAARRHRYAATMPSGGWRGAQHHLRMAGHHAKVARQAMDIGTSNTYRPGQLLSFTGTAAGAAKDPRIAAGAAGGGRFGSGGGTAAGAQPKQQTRAQRKAALLATAKKDRARAKLLAIRIRADRAALASASGKVTKGQKGAVTTAKRSTTGSTAPAAKGAASPMSNASTGLSPQAVTKAAAVAAAQAKHMSKAQLASAIKAMTAQEKQLLAAATTAAAQAAKL